MPLRHTPPGDVELTTGTRTVRRVGYAPDPFAWTPWQYATDGRFTGRWDDPDGTYRTLHVGDQLLGCLFEVLADFRPDLQLLAEISAITDNDDADPHYPTTHAGTVPRSWLAPRTGRARRVAADANSRS